MITLFSERAEILVDDLATKEGEVVDMEERFCSVTLDIIGEIKKNYNVSSDSDVISEGKHSPPPH